jgi:hypothetical protein
MFSTVLPSELLFGGVCVTKSIYEIFLDKILDEWTCGSVMVFGCFIGLTFINLWIGDCVEISCNYCIPLFGLSFYD